ncbi:MAG TPA: hypothetical protein PLP23_22065 [Panacibacter sp.]|nr:hypothetical protein [Panacibacter sp.]
MKYLIVIAAALFFSVTLFAQDQIIKRNGQVVKAKVIEVGTSEIKYKLPDNIDGPLYAIDKNTVTKIIYENGHVDNFTTDIKDTANYTGQLTKAIKINFLAPLLGYSEFSFEKSTGVGKSYELSLGIIGLGKSQLLTYNSGTLAPINKNQFGFFASAGYKFNKWPDFLFGRTRFTHIMQGAYAKPIIYLGNYSENREVYKPNDDAFIEKKNITFGALQIEFGKQWVFGEKFLIDIYWGLGYGADNKNKSDGYAYYSDATSAYNYANARLGKSPGLSSTFGLKAGLLIK